MEDVEDAKGVDFADGVRRRFAPWDGGTARER
jgi:hypothetical protein